jgi:hypothetical protein
MHTKKQTLSKYYSDVPFFALFVIGLPVWACARRACALSACLPVYVCVYVVYVVAQRAYACRARAQCAFLHSCLSIWVPLARPLATATVPLSPGPRVRAPARPRVLKIETRYTS